MSDHEVIIAGAGPTGMMLAAELKLAGVDAVILERRRARDVGGSRSGGLHARTLEVLDQRGIAARFLTEGRAMQVQSFAGIPVTLEDFPTRHNHGLALWQSRCEVIWATWIAELGVPVLWESEVAGFSQNGSGVTVDLSGGSRLRTNYLVGCDGGRSAVRRTAGIEWAGSEPTTSWLIAEVQMTGEPLMGMREGGGIGPADEGRIRVVLADPQLEAEGEPDLEDVRRALVRVDGTDHGVHSPHWISRFNDRTRLARTYRRQRVLIAGDAAHVHPPVGGQGLNLGIQDAVNLGWKLGLVVREAAPDALLDTYEAERRPVGARVVHNTLAQGALNRPDDRSRAMRDVMTELLALDGPRRHIAGMISGLDIHYDLGAGHPLLGRRMPDLDLLTADGPTRVFSLLHSARGVLLNFTEGAEFAIGPWRDRVRYLEARPQGVWELPLLGMVDPPSAVLVRPDGHVAWTGQLADAALLASLTTWFGPPSV